MATNINNLTTSQQAIANQIIARSQSIGAPSISVQTAINIANTESTFNPTAQNSQTSAFGSFHYITKIWQPT